MIVTDERVVWFVSAKVGTRFYMPYTAMGVERDGAILGGAVFNCFTGPDVEMTVAGEARAFTRGFYRAVYRYLFGQLGCERVSITTESLDVVRLAERLGAQVEGMKRNCFGRGRDAFLLGILKDEWAIR